MTLVFWQRLYEVISVSDYDSTRARFSSEHLDTLDILPSLNGEVLRAKHINFF